LSHFVIIHAMRENGMEAWGTGVFTLLAGILAIAWAAMVYQVIERPLHKVRAGLSGH
jgi:peptidoglycan/LPS O-acetylase OafA/YrhL